MKARIPTFKYKDVQNAVARSVEKVSYDSTKYTIALMLIALHERYGFGIKRMNDLLDATQAVASNIRNSDTNAVDRLKEYGVDIDAK